MTDKKIKSFVVDELRDGRYVRATKTRESIDIQIWNSGTPVGDPDGDWAMPKILGVEISIEQALLQTPK